MRVKTGALLLLAFIVSCLVPLAASPPAQAVQGDVEWTRMVPHHYYPAGSAGTGVITHGDGTVTATACGGTANLEDAQSTTLSPTGDVLGTITGLNQGAVCMNRGVAGIDGMLFYTEQLTSSMSVQKLVASKNGVQVASHSIKYGCSIGGSTPYYGVPSGMKIGADGNLYAVITRQSCSTTPNLLVSLDGQNGQIRFQQPLTYGNTYQGNNTIGVYDSGVVVAEDNASSSFPDLLSYYSYAGNKDNALSCAIDSVTDSCGFSYSGSSIGSIRRILVEPSGTTYLEVWGGTCSTRYKFMYTVGGVGSTIASPTSCTELVRIMPNGNRVFSDGSTVVVTDSSGVTQYSGGLASKPGYTFIRNPYPVDLQIDGNGDIVVLRYARLNTSSVRHVYVDKLNANSTWTTLFSTEQLPNPNGYSFYLEPAYEVPNVAFAKDYMYLAACRAACSSTNGPIVSKISMPGMEVEYPRSAVFNEYYTDNGEPLNYVALGDSFSSGKGVEPYITGTDTPAPSENRCNRSTAAYPMLLDGATSVDLNLRHFRACTGATVSDLRSGMWGEPGQLDWITQDTDVVTLTIGGNDVGFGTYAEVCMEFGCDATTVAYDNIVQAIASELDPRLELLYKDILDVNPGLELYVIGYPYITLSDIPEPYYCESTLANMSADDSAAAYEVVTLLNQAIEDAIDVAIVDGYGSRIHYVDPNQSGGPFENHTLCNLEPFFLGTSVPDLGSSFHPDVSGQAAYGVVVRDAMTP